MSVVDEIKQRLDIVDVLSAYMPLQKAGRHYKALCPFHSEKTPSFIVFPETQGWHCFGACGTGGDIFTFVMRRENMDFAEALRFLAEKAGIELRPLDTEELKQRELVDRLRAINAAAAQYYHRLLLEAPQAAEARAYLQRRGVDSAALATFQLGYALDDWHHSEQELLRQGYAREDLITLGLLVQNEAGRVYDRFRGRIMFPIRDVQGHVIGFAGRALGDGQPKYMNSPQTPLFDKSNALYGIDLTREAIRESGVAIVVEGYMDVIIPYQHGVRNLVACMGTALTDAHLQALKRSVKRLILALDPDEAGLRAVERGVETARQGLDQRVVPVLTATGLVRYESQLDAEIRVMVLPDGMDPDELILRDRARWDQLVEHAKPVADFYLDVALAPIDVSTAKGKRELVERFLPMVAAMASPVEQAHYIQRLAQRVRIDERQLSAQLERLRGGQAHPGAARAPTQKAAPPSSSNAHQAILALEERCLALMLQHPAFVSQALEHSTLSAEAFTDVRNRQVMQAIQVLLAAEGSYSRESLAVRLDSELSAHVESLLQRLGGDLPLSPDMAREDLEKCSARLQKHYLSRLIHELRFLQQDAQEQGDRGRQRELSQIADRLKRISLEIDRCYDAATLAGRRKSKPSPTTESGA